MKFLSRLFPAGHFVIGVMFLLSSAALIVVAALQFWHGIQFFAEGPLTARLNAVLESIAVLTVAIIARPCRSTSCTWLLPSETHI